MKKKFTGISFILLLSITAVLVQSYIPVNKTAKREFYQLTIYHFKTIEQEKIIDNYLQNALLPALHKMKFTNIGVFKNKANDTALCISAGTNF
jgi:hypothetical protein